MNSSNPDPSEPVPSRLRAKLYSDLPKATEIDVKRSLCQICRAPGNFYWRNGPLRVLCTEHEDERCAIEFFDGPSR